MDEKIKSYAKQVGIIPLNDATKIGFTEERTSYYCKGYMLEQLFTIIVNECIDTLRHSHSGNEEWHNILNDIEYDIKVKFGIHK